MKKSEAIEKLIAYHKCQRLQVKGIYEDCNEKLCDNCDLCYAQGNTGEHIKSIEIAYLVDDLIEIVNRGGVSNDVCEWKKQNKTYDWKPICEPNSTYNVAGVGWFKYCPYCGKKIKIVGD